MNYRETARYDMFGRVQTFGTDNAADFAVGGKALGYFANITQIIKDLDKAKAGQLGGVTAKTVLLDALRLDVRNIARTAAAIAQDEPGFADHFPYPATGSQKDLLTTAAAYLVELANPGIAAKFIAYELPADFVQDLLDDRAAIDGAKDEVESDDIEGVENTGAVGRPIKAGMNKAGMKEVNYLNAIMHNKYSRNGDKLRAWKSASHIERAPQTGEARCPDDSVVWSQTDIPEYAEENPPTHRRPRESRLASGDWGKRQPSKVCTSALDA